MRDEQHKLITIAQLKRNNNGGYFSWIITSNNLQNPSIRLLLDQFASEAGRMGCGFLFASAPKDSVMVDHLKKNGFISVGWEQVWAYRNALTEFTHEKSGWKPANDLSLHAVSLLQHQILPPAEKLIAPSVHREPPQYIFQQNGEVLGYARVIKNNKSTIVTPMLSSTIRNPERTINSLVDIIYTNGNLLYIIQRSNQNWAESIILEHYKKVAPTRNRMVKHMTVRITQTAKNMSRVIEGNNTDVITPVSKSTQFKDKI